MTKLELKDVSFSFGKKLTVDNVSLTVQEGSFTTLLGPSGCGKTTLLRLISGFLEPQSGKILIDGIDQAGIEVNRRKVGIVFQDYALFPHLNVAQNISYGMKIQKTPSKEIQQAVQETALSLGIEDLLLRYPNELSGGQQQRVALARSLILKPKILLMDEPLSSLDTKLRTKVREELKEIQQQLRITTVFVTHDQQEALSLSTEIAVLDQGKILQTGSPRKIYFEPNSEFTADFVGKANFIQRGSEKFMVRPEWFKIVSGSGEWPCEPAGTGIVPAETIVLSGRVLSHEFLGSKSRFVIMTDAGTKITADFDTIESENIELGAKITLASKKCWKM